eukprot:364998-Chlamydomonas_euryale.AAC.4
MLHPLHPCPQRLPAGPPQPAAHARVRKGITEVPDVESLPCGVRCPFDLGKGLMWPDGKGQIGKYCEKAWHQETAGRRGSSRQLAALAAVAPADSWQAWHQETAGRRGTSRQLANVAAADSWQAWQQQTAGGCGTSRQLAGVAAADSWRLWHQQTAGRRGTRRQLAAVRRGTNGL